MSRKKEMDNLAKDAAAALAAGMSYGRWKAMQGEPKKIETVEGMPKGWQRCKWCNRIFKPTKKGRQLYCEISCQRAAQDFRDKQKKEGEQNGS
jgi:hypothetical protein